MLLNADKISLKYLDKVLFKDSSFVINDTDKVGLIGVNGVGKSSLLKTIVGEVELNSGTLSKKKDLKIAYLEQDNNYLETDSLLKAFLKKSPVDDFVAKSMLSKMGLNDYDRLIGGLSGGEKKRLGLAVTLSKPCDLLILDEPTNHLDIWMINWLEKFLLKWNKGLLLVTHDRYFLERVCNHIMEIDRGSIYMYEASYSTFLSLKEEREQSMIASERKLSAILKKEAAWAALNPQARTTKSTERLARFKQLEETVSDMRSTINQKEDFEISSISSRIGKTTIEIYNVSKSINDKLLFSDFSYNIPKFDRVGIVGENGAGKTTFIKTILGLIEPDKGSVVIGKTMKIGYFVQEPFKGNMNVKIIDYLKSFGEYVETLNGKLSASQLLEQYLFTPAMQQQTISKLSGGERRRLQLLTVLITNPNILFLDEPTNDLDIYTLDILETYLENFKGAVLVVSHDRYFLDKVANHLFVFNNGKIDLYNGIVSDYMEENPTVKKEEVKEKVKVVVDIPRFTSQEKKEFDHIEDDIFLLEEEIEALKQESISCGSDYEKLMKITEEIEKKEKELENKYARWEYLNDINERIIKYREQKYIGD